MVIALAACVLVANAAPRGYEDPISWGSALFIFILCIFSYWNDLGGWIALGLICFIGQWGALYAFVVSSEGKVWWYILSLFSLTCYFPISINGPWWYLAGGFLILTLGWWIVPVVLTRSVESRRTNHRDREPHR